MVTKALRGAPVPRDKAENIGQDFMINCPTSWSFAGSIRRKKEEVGNIDIVAIRGDWILEWLLIKFGMSVKDTPKTYGKVEGVYIDVYLAEDEDWGSQILRWTGPRSFNSKLQLRAKHRDLVLNQYGLFSIRDRKMIAGQTEEGIFQALGMSWIRPEDRE